MTVADVVIWWVLTGTSVFGGVALFVLAYADDNPRHPHVARIGYGASAFCLALGCACLALAVEASIPHL